MSRWSTAPADIPAAAHRPRGKRRGPGRALLVSLLAHALLLSLTFGGEGLGLPGLALPWQARRAEVPDLRVVLVAPPPLPAKPAPPLPAPTGEAGLPPTGPTTPAAAPPPEPAPAPAPIPAPTLIAVDRPRATTWSVPPPPPASAPVVPTVAPEEAPPVVASLGAAPPSVLEVTRMRETTDTLRAALDGAARDRIADAAQIDATRRDLQQGAERLAEAQRQAAARQEAALRQEAERQEAERQAAERQAAARRLAAQQEASRQEAARAEAARQEAARAEAARQEASRVPEAARAEAARQEAVRAQAARAEAARAEAAARAATKMAEKAAEKAAEEQQREARLRAIGQQLNEEAARRDAARQAAANNLPSSWSTARRGRLFGRTDANAEMVLYAEAFARKIQLNPTSDAWRDLVRQAHTDPLVTVAIRSDGTVESVSFYRSSGLPALDDAVRRIIEAQANYPAFPPALAREYDVIEIRRTWHFDTAIRLY